MVRSEGERVASNDEAKQLAQQIRDAEKFFAVSLSEITQALTTKGVWRGFEDLRLTDKDGEVFVPVLCQVRTKAPTSAGWAVAIVAGGVRIDGIDHEGERGWHRHHWDAKRLDGNRIKKPASSFGEAMTLEEFVLWSFKALKVRINKYDGTGSLFGS